MKFLFLHGQQPCYEIFQCSFLIVELTGFSPLKPSIPVMTVLMAVIVMQTASILDLARIIAHVQQVI